ncbi:hypothetical protein O6H91_06G044300 [Diphasiastrum complanatum]|nr:hypothetical protein O6H91_06G044300 [Diphasiastrum complanatum]
MPAFPQGRSIYEPPKLELQRRNRVHARKYFPKKRRAPHAPRNTTSFILQAKKGGGITSFVSPIPATPAVLTTPAMSPAPRYREGLVDEVNKEWGVDGYGSMNGLIRLRYQGECEKDDVESDCDSDSDSDMDHDLPAQSVQQLEQRLDQGLSRFEMIYPSDCAHKPGPVIVDTYLKDQESHIANLEEENISLKERLYIMEQEMEDLRRQLQHKENRASETEQDDNCSEQSVANVAPHAQN